MKYLFALMLICLATSTFAGELATLHYERVGKNAPESSESAEATPKLPEGMTLAPGVRSLGGSGLPDRSKHGISEVGLERSRCLTDCPAYTVILNADGTFRYTGEYGVERMGEHTGTISVGELNQVFSFINESLFMGFEDTYSADFLDAPTTYIMIKKGKDLKIIENYANTGPATLWAIEQLIDGLLETATWDEGGGVQ
ncbi:MAG: DUF6438 domain-containing protein [Trueperaceae bacterium]